MTLLLRLGLFLSCFLDDAMFILIMFMALVYLTVDENPLSLKKKKKKKTNSPIKKKKK